MNVIDLSFGANRIRVFGSDFSPSKSKDQMQVAKIGFGLTIDSVALEVFEPPRVVGLGTPVSLAVGISTDEEFFVRWFAPSGFNGRFEKRWGDGNYFLNKTTFDSDTFVHLAYSVASGVFSVGSPISFADSQCTASGNGYVAFLVHAKTVDTEYFNGSVWLSSVSVPLRSANAAAVGQADHFLMFGGSNGLPMIGEPANIHSKTQFFNGVGWVMMPDHPYPVFGEGGVGTPGHALSYGGTNNNSTILNYSALFNGTVWSQGPNLGTTRYKQGSFGEADDAVAAGGSSTFNPTTVVGTCERYNGVSWYSIASLPHVRTGATGLGNVVSRGMVCMGHYWSGSTGVYLQTTYFYQEPVWVLGPDTTLARTQATRSGDNGVGILAAGHYRPAGGSDTMLSAVDLLRSSDNPISASMRLTFVLT